MGFKNMNETALIYRLLVAYLTEHAKATGQKLPVLPIRLLNYRYIKSSDKFFVEYKNANGVYEYVTL